MGWSVVHVIGWSVYLGGALVMELVWRPAQEEMPPAQIAVACQWMGRRYRWVASVALLAIGTSGAALAVGSDRSLGLGTSYGRTVAALAFLWLVLAAILLAITFLAHPGLHVRMAVELSDVERAAARERVRQAIVWMDRLLRLDLAIALLAALLGAGLHSGGVL